MNYNKLWKLLIDRNMKRTDLLKVVGISSATLAKMNKGQAISMDVMIRLCNYFHCELSDLVSLNRPSEEVEL